LNRGIAPPVEHAKEFQMKKLIVALVAALAAQATFAAGGAAAPGPATLKGEVLEIIDVDSYTYLRMKTAGGEIWAAVGKANVRKGAEVTIVDPAVMENFESRALKRTFPTIVFGTLGGAAPVGDAASAPAANAAAPHAGANPGQPHGGAAKPAAVVVAKVAKAEGPTGRTVGEVAAQRAALKDKPVTVRATVVKVNAGVMGKNWVHLRDGSGTAADGSDDLIETSKDDVDLGAGYAYKVLVENASFRK
jgi:hypothetical protein